MSEPLKTPLAALLLSKIGAKVAPPQAEADESLDSSEAFSSVASELLVAIKEGNAKGVASALESASSISKALASPSD
jgi:hypothetical protein